MWMGKIGQKSAAFINHKPFHPGNWQNQEKIWLAEQKHKEELRKQAELAERRAEEVKIQELRRALYSQGTAAANKTQASPKVEGDDAARKAALIEARKREAARAAAIRAAELRKGSVKSVLYDEDVYLGSHTQVWGSFFDKETQKWGFRCCRVCDKQVLSCPVAAAGSPEKTRGRKHRKRVRKDGPENQEDPREEPVGRDSCNVSASQDEKNHRDSESRADHSSGKSTGESAFYGQQRDKSNQEPGEACAKQEDDQKHKKKKLLDGKPREGGLAGILQLLKEENAFEHD
ncbi:putative step ii splicing factor [Besnoitia besnoiti]|uniref:Putative step ii splicing factor n=1 Tax=Besnoitia besnoiti TaxID=94643 RepID=A0A2A9MIK8_BESBE|nr:putative step ii splicing factor [Besnoitia besnoiti]PFH37739.1 putative step ii splicing factor [Besnoitia besnoiti]